MKVGHRNGKLITLEKLGGRPCLWRCQCDCGNEKIAKDIHLYKNKGSVSCGCLSAKRADQSRFTEKFIMQKVDIDKNNCWNWKGSKHRQGYGNVRFRKSTFLAHRLSWIIFKGEIEDNLKVCHSCDNPSCVNPEHLFLGTQKDNVRDAISKNRMIKNIPRTRRCKLNYEQVLAIRDLHQKGYTRKELQNEYEVSQTCIAKIITNKSWNTNWQKEL